jgi:hypothetical protein
MENIGVYILKSGNPGCLASFVAGTITTIYASPLKRPNACNIDGIE